MMIDWCVWLYTIEQCMGWTFSNGSLSWVPFQPSPWRHGPVPRKLAQWRRPSQKPHCQGSPHCWPDQKRWKACFKNLLLATYRQHLFKEGILLFVTPRSVNNDDLKTLVSTYKISHTSPHFFLPRFWTSPLRLRQWQQDQLLCSWKIDKCNTRWFGAHNKACFTFHRKGCQLL